MNAARRGHKRRDWPRGLREPRPGYYAWEHPMTGKILPIGRVPLATAKAEAMAANLHIDGQRPTLVDRLTGAHRSVGELMDKMPEAENKNTAKTQRSQDKIIRAAIGNVPAAGLTVAHCAEVLAALVDSDKVRQAQAVRSRLMMICAKGQALGWMDGNPAAVTENPRPQVKRGRLTLEMWKAIHAVAPQVCEWLQRVMEMALVTGADRSTIAGLTRADVVGDELMVMRSKTENSTGLRIAIPLALRLDAAGLTLRDLVTPRTGVVSKYLIHHVNPWGNAPAGSPVHPDNMSRSFTAARVLAGIPDTLPDGKGAPTLHEIRSLAKRLYIAQGNVDHKTLLGHSTERAANVYADPRGAEPVRVRIG